MNTLENEPLFYCGVELHKAKILKVQDALRTFELDGVIFLKHDAVRYVTSFYTKGYRPFLEFDYAAVVPTGDDAVLGFTLGGEERRAAIRSRVHDIRKLPIFSQWGEGLSKILIDYNLTKGRVGFDLLPHFIYDSIREKFPQLELVDIRSIWANLTAIKHPLEIELLEHALKIAQVGVSEAINVLEPGKSEIEVSAA